MKDHKTVPQEVRREALYRRIHHYTWQGFKVVSETETEAELIGRPQGGCLIDAPLNLMLFVSFLSAPVFYILAAPSAWLLSRPLVGVMARIRALLPGLGFGRVETVVVLTLSVDDAGRVHENRRLRDLK